MRLVYLAAAWAFGVVLSAHQPDRAPLAWFIVSVVTVIGWACVRRWQTALAVAFALGGFRLTLTPSTAPVAALIGVGGMTLEGVVMREPDRRDDRILLRVEAEAVTRLGRTDPINGGVLVEAPVTTSIRYGDRIRAAGELNFPGEFDTFSYADYLARQGVYAQMRGAAVEVVDAGHGSPILSTLIDFKGQAKAHIRAAIPDPAAGLLIGILLGDERGIPPELKADFAATSTAHIVAISGFNMAVLGGTVISILRRVMPSRPRTSALIGIVAIAVYTLFVAGGAAVWRAAIMTSLLIFAPLLRRKTYVPASLALTVIVFSALDPFTLWDIGFQLSFFAVIGLALFATPATAALERSFTRWLPKRAVSPAVTLVGVPLATNLAAQIITLPLTALYFHRVSLVSLPVNLLIGMVQPAILILGMSAAVLGLALPIVGQVVFWLTQLPLLWTIGVVRAFALLPFADTNAYISEAAVAGVYGLVFVGMIVTASKPRWWAVLAGWFTSRRLQMGLVTAAAAILIYAGLAAAFRPDGRLHIWILDMGGGNALLAQTPSGAHILVDGGRFPSRLMTALGDRLPFYDRQIELLILSQPDPVHFSALLETLRWYSPALVIDHGQPNRREQSLQLRRLLDGVPRQIVVSGDVIEFGDGVRITILHPPTQPDLGGDLDDVALVFRLSYGEFSLLWTGELSRNGQVALLERPLPLESTVLLLPEHGAARSLDNDFLAAVKPSAALLQVERGNLRGEPTPELLDQLEGTPIYRTDHLGTLHLWTDGRELWIVGTYKPTP